MPELELEPSLPDTHNVFNVFFLLTNIFLKRVKSYRRAGPL